MLDIKLKTENEKIKTGRAGRRRGLVRYSLLIAVLLAMVAGGVMTGSYPHFQKNAAKAIENAKKGDDGKKEKSEELRYDEDMKKDLLSAIVYMNYELGDQRDAFSYFTENYDSSKLTGEERTAFVSASDVLLRYLKDRYGDLTMDDEEFLQYKFYGDDIRQNSRYHYSCYGVILDAEGHTKKEFGTNRNLYQTLLSNPDQTEASVVPDYKAGLVICYDENGIPAVSDCWGFNESPASLLNDLKSAGISDLELAFAWQNLSGLLEAVEKLETEEQLDRFNMDAMRLNQIPFPLIRNTTFVFGINHRENIKDEYQQSVDTRATEEDAWLLHGYLIMAWGIGLFMITAALILQNIPGLRLRDSLLFTLPAEVYVILVSTGIPMAGIMAYHPGFARVTMGNDIQEALQSLGFPGMTKQYLYWGLIWAVWTVFAFFWYWVAASLLPYLTHPVKTLKENLLFLKIIKWGRDAGRRLLFWATEIRLPDKEGKVLLKFVLVNGLAMILSCLCWVYGILPALIYSAALYVFLKKRYGSIHDAYIRLLLRTKRIAEAENENKSDEAYTEKQDEAHMKKQNKAHMKNQNEAHSEPREDVFDRIHKELDRVQESFFRAVSAEVRSRNMKTELITNVSHDLKTPLTAIITYLDLLKQEDITDEQHREYLATLDQRVQRLKKLIEDLFEASKAATGDIIMNYEEVDMASFMKQIRLENEDRINESTLDFRWSIPEEKYMVKLDPNRIYRVMDNLLQNALKYSMPHTRVYVDMVKDRQNVIISIKNISLEAMNFSAEKITERFVRGDLSRNTEGSGLGLAIARSFTELMGGKFDVKIDGDLFKAVMEFHLIGINR